MVIFAGSVVILLLLFCIRKQLNNLKHKESLKKALQTKSEATRKHIINSIRVLARCIIADQVEFSEACIRIKVLIDALAPEMHQDPDYLIFNEIYESTAHMPTHEARKEVDRRFLFKLDKQRWELEAINETNIRKAAEKLLKHPLLLA
jgi:hypothetical protein